MLYAPRRCGKSSISKNIIPQELKSKNFMAIYCDFMGTKTKEEVAFRLSKGLAEGMEEYIPAQKLFEAAKQIIKNMTIAFDTNPITGEASFGLAVKKGQGPSISSITKNYLELSKKYNCLFIFDEFQDIKDVDDTLSLLRTDLQTLKNTPILFLGSKRRLLNEIFTSYQSPFFNFADEYILKPIPLQDWVEFFEERLNPIKVNLAEEALSELLKISLDVPNTICEIGSYIQSKCKKEKINNTKLFTLIDELINAKSESFYFQLKQLTSSEGKILSALAKNEYTLEIQSKSFQAMTELSLSGIKKSINKLYNNGLVEEEAKGYRLSNPLFRLFLLKNPVV